jgi:hypothetical protein
MLIFKTHERSHSKSLLLPIFRVFAVFRNPSAGRQGFLLGGVQFVSEINEICFAKIKLHEWVWNFILIYNETRYSVCRRLLIHSIYAYLMYEMYKLPLISFKKHFLSQCDIAARTVLLYVLLCLTYMYCTLYILYILHTVHIVHVFQFPMFACLLDVEASSSTSVHACFCSHFY